MMARGGLSCPACVRRVVCASILVAVLMATGAAAVSAAPPIVACQNRHTGQLRLIQPAQGCFPTEIRHEFQSYAGATEDEAALQQQIDDLAGRVAALESRMDTAEGDIDTLEDRATVLEGRMDTAEGDIDNLETRATTNEGEIDNLETRATNLESRVSTNEGNITGLDGRLDTAETDINNLETRVTTAETSITTLDTRVTNIRNFFTGVANAIIGCFTGPGAIFSITVPALELPAFTILEVTVGPFPITPAFTIGVPVFDANQVIGCLNGVVTATAQ